MIILFLLVILLGLFVVVNFFTTIPWFPILFITIVIFVLLLLIHIVRWYAVVCCRQKDASSELFPAHERIKNIIIAKLKNGDYWHRRSYTGHFWFTIDGKAQVFSSVELYDAKILPLDDIQPPGKPKGPQNNVIMAPFNFGPRT